MLAIASQHLRSYLAPARRATNFVQNDTVALVLYVAAASALVLPAWYLINKYSRKQIAKGTAGSYQWSVWKDSSECPKQLYWKVIVSESVYSPGHPMSGKNGYRVVGTILKGGCATTKEQAIADVNAAIVVLSQPEASE